MSWHAGILLIGDWLRSPENTSDHIYYKEVRTCTKVWKEWLLANFSTKQITVVWTAIGHRCKVEVTPRPAFPALKLLPTRTIEERLASRGYTPTTATARYTARVTLHMHLAILVLTMSCSRPRNFINNQYFSDLFPPTHLWSFFGKKHYW